MKKIIVIFTVVTCMLAISGCTRQDVSSSIEEIPGTEMIDNRTDGEFWADIAVEDYYNCWQYEEYTPITKEEKEEFNTRTKRFEEYIKFFDVFPSSKKEEKYIKKAKSENPEDRLEVATKKDCPMPLLVKIAKDDPDPQIRMRAQGHLLTLEVAEDYLKSLAISKYKDAKLTAIMHPNVTGEIISILMKDEDGSIRKEANRLLTEA